MPVYVSATSRYGNLGFEDPSGQDIYMSADPLRIDPGEMARQIQAQLAAGRPILRGQLNQSLVEGVVAVHGCTSSSAMFFGTMRPGPFEGRRSVRASMILGCVHQPRWVLPPPVSSVQWGRSRSSLHRPVPAGTSPGYSGDPCFCVIGSYLEAGVEVFFGAAQCAALGFNTRQERLPRPVVASRARPWITAQGFIFGLCLALLAALCAGCADPVPEPLSDASRAADTWDASLDTPPSDIVVAPFDASDATSDADSDVPSDASRDASDADASLFPFDIPGTVQFDSYPMPSQQRRSCPASRIGDPDIPPPRLVSPLSPLRVTTQRPTLSWELPPGVTGVRIELCRDPCCVTVLQRLTVEGSRVRLDPPLSPGPVFWRAKSIREGRESLEYSFTWEFSVPHRDSELDTFKGSIHDFNGDGYDDIAAGVYPGVRIYWGGSDGLGERRFTDYRIDYPGQALSNIRLQVSDVNSDGFADVIVEGEAVLIDSGYVFSTVRVLFGGPNEMTDSGSSHIVGYVTGIVDVNGDGFVDLIGATPAILPRTMRAYALVLYGGEAWHRNGRVIIEGPSRDEVTPDFGSAGSGGDVDGDGYGDFYISDSRFNQYRGRLYYYRGRADGLIDTHARAFDPPPQLEHHRPEWGAPFGVGDVNGDRLADLMVQSEEPQQVLLFGARTTDGISTYVFRSTYPSSRGGAGTGPATDLNGDGVQDLFLGCSQCVERDRPLATPGIVVVATRFASGTPTILGEFGPPPNDGMRGGRYWGGTVLAIDVNGDGYDDLVTFDPEWSFPYPGRGYISVIFGGPDFGQRRQQIFGVELRTRIEGIFEIAARSAWVGTTEEA